MATPLIAQNTTDTFSPDGLIAGACIETTEALITGGVAYARGDLLVVSASNVVSLATAGTLANARYIMPFNLSIAESTAHAATGKQLGFYNDGEFDQDFVKLAGVALTAPQIVAAKPVLTAVGVQLRKVV